MGGADCVWDLLGGDGRLGSRVLSIVFTLCDASGSGEGPAEEREWCGEGSVSKALNGLAPLVFFQHAVPIYSNTTPKV